ncbi:hypothetical protein KIN20_034258 [Parelaphostrongylus tenuis]|uniref:Target of rapamycin complex subunit lst8 n=1 Tax=Parelaphostrongylus tenuis TaxID=148309 RepID=A0AAD5WJX1_PARTN|nr:hypothetical protein KIN20_034258 [Parelaphostrongylus tenuis]
MPSLSYQEFVTSLAVHPSANTLAGITNRGNLIVWDLSNGTDEWAQKKYIERNTETVARLKNNDVGKRAICKSYGLSCRYSPDGRVLLTTAFTCDSRVVFTGGSDNRIKLWDMDSRQMMMKYDGHTKPITALCISDVPLR